jgi:hypothetical protein
VETSTFELNFASPLVAIVMVRDPGGGPEIEGDDGSKGDEGESGRENCVPGEEVSRLNIKKRLHPRCWHYINGRHFFFLSDINGEGRGGVCLPKRGRWRARCAAHTIFIGRGKQIHSSLFVNLSFVCFQPSIGSPECNPHVKKGYENLKTGLQRPSQSWGLTLSGGPGDCDRQNLTTGT